MMWLSACGSCRTCARAARRLWLPIALVLCAVSMGTEASERLEFTVNGVDRSAWVHIPEAAGTDTLLPLVIAFHGSAWNGRMMEDITGFSQLADQEVFAVVYPNGTGPGDIFSWNAGYCCSTALEQQVDDISFVDELLLRLVDDYPIDPDRIFVTGFSNGAMMTYALALLWPDRFVAIASVAGAMYPSQLAAGVPLPVLVLHGTEDAVLPYGGGWGALGSLSGRTEPILSIQEVTAFWRGNNGCSATSSAVSTQRNARIEHFAACDSSSSVVLISIVDGRHVWPVIEANNSDFLLTEDAAELLSSYSSPSDGTVAWDVFETGIDASETIWSFFAQHLR